MAYSHIAHDCKIKNNAIIVNSVQLGGHIEIGEWAIVGGLSAIHQYVKIGKHSMISGGALVRKDVPPYTKAAREPLSFVGINSVGLRRRGFDNNKIREVQNIYRTIFQSKLNNTQALDKLEAEFPVSKERDEIIDFIRNSGRGIMKGYNQN
jgi:UDP-N-acetylglucosamine acyltransferase